MQHAGHCPLHSFFSSRKGPAPIVTPKSAPETKRSIQGDVVSLGVVKERSSAGRSGSKDVALIRVVFFFVGRVEGERSCSLGNSVAILAQGGVLPGGKFGTGSM
eukprot:756413-Amphidinium_carterae.1